MIARCVGLAVFLALCALAVALGGCAVWLLGFPVSAALVLFSFAGCLYLSGICLVVFAFIAGYWKGGDL